MHIKFETLHRLADSVDPVTGTYIKQFIMECEAKSKAEVEAAKKVLWEHGIKTSDD